MYNIRLDDVIYGIVYYEELSMFFSPTKTFVSDLPVSTFVITFSWHCQKFKLVVVNEVI